MFALYAVFLVALGAISIKTLMVLGRGSPWTSVGWALTIGYVIIVGLEFTYGRAIAVVGYADLAALTIAFVMAGVRDERQGAPWFWPVRLDPSRRERQR